jgi:hypothetical protein
MREATGDKDDGVVVVAKLALCLEPEPLRPSDLDKIFRESGACDLLGAFDGYSRRPVAARSLASDDEIVGEPSGIARLPIDAGDAPEIDAESIRPAEEIQKEAGSHRALITETGPTSHLNWRFLLQDFLPFFIRHHPGSLTHFPPWAPGLLFAQPPASCWSLIQVVVLAWLGHR